MKTKEKKEGGLFVPQDHAIDEKLRERKICIVPGMA